MKILLINQPLGNRGDESAHRALVRALLKHIPDVQIRVLFVDCYSPWSVEQYKIVDDRISYININHVRWYNRVSERSLKQTHFCKWLWNIHPTTRSILNQYGWADVVVCAPGGINLGGFQDWEHLYMLELAQYANKPLAYFGRSFGPFNTSTAESKKFYELSLAILRYCSFLSVRDHKTAQFAKDMNLSYVETIDTAFLDNPNIKLPYEIRHELNKPYAVFVPNELIWHYAYKDKIERKDLIEFYNSIIKRIWQYDPELSIVMLPQLYGTWHIDVDFFRDIAESLADDRVIVLPDCYSSDIQQTIIKDASFVMGARYHSIVFAINQNVPFIALSYEHKMAGLLESLHKTNVSIDISDSIFDESGRNKCLDSVSMLLPTLKADYGAQEQAKQLALNGFDTFISYLNQIN